MTSPWKDGIASDLDSSPEMCACGRFQVYLGYGVCDACAHDPAHPINGTASKLREISPDQRAQIREAMKHETFDYPQQVCDCADCRAIIALVEEETIDKP